MDIHTAYYGSYVWSFYRIRMGSIHPIRNRGVKNGQLPYRNGYGATICFPKSQYACPTR